MEKNGITTLIRDHFSFSTKIFVGEFLKPTGQTTENGEEKYLKLNEQEMMDDFDKIRKENGWKPRKTPAEQQAALLAQIQQQQLQAQQAAAGQGASSGKKGRKSKKAQAAAQAEQQQQQSPSAAAAAAAAALASLSPAMTPEQKLLARLQAEVQLREQVMQQQEEYKVQKEAIR